MTDGRAFLCRIVTAADRRANAMRYDMGTGGEIRHHPSAAMKALYITDEIDTCDCCGRTDLKATVAMQLSDGGGILHYGRTCAARNSGKTSKQIKKEIADNRQARIDAAYNELRETPAKQAWHAKRIELYAKYKGRLSSAEWSRMIAPEADALEAVIQQIAKKHGIPAGCL